MKIKYTYTIPLFNTNMYLMQLLNIRMTLIFFTNCYKTCRTSFQPGYSCTCLLLDVNQFKKKIQSCFFEKIYLLQL